MHVAYKSKCGIGMPPLPEERISVSDFGYLAVQEILLVKRG